VVNPPIWNLSSIIWAILKTVLVLPVPGWPEIATLTGIITGRLQV